MKIPETPIWLLSKNRPEEAECALQCLRGGVDKETISNELNQLQQILELTKSCSECNNNNISTIDCDHKSASTYMEQIGRSDTAANNETIYFNHTPVSSNAIHWHDGDATILCSNTRRS